MVFLQYYSISLNSTFSVAYLFNVWKDEGCYQLSFFDFLFCLTFQEKKNALCFDYLFAKVRSKVPMILPWYKQIKKIPQNHTQYWEKEMPNLMRSNKNTNSSVGSFSLSPLNPLQKVAAICLLLYKESLILLNIWTSNYIDRISSKQFVQLVGHNMHSM